MAAQKEIVAFNTYDYNFKTGEIKEFLHTGLRGAFSEACNTNNAAIGEYSHAEGFRTGATGTASHAENRGSIALGEYSHAEGNTTLAKGNSSHSEGKFSHVFVVIKIICNSLFYSIKFNLFYLIFKDSLCSVVVVFQTCVV